MRQTKLINAFEAIRNELKDSFSVTGDTLLVEALTTQEKEVKKGSIILAAAATTRQVNGIEATRPNLVRVVSVGAGYIDDAGKDVPNECEAGDIILVGRLSCHWFSCFGSVPCESGFELGIVREKDVLMRFKGGDSFDIAEEILRKYSAGES